MRLHHVDHGGDGTTLLALHGFTGSAETWDPLAHALGGTSRVIALDLLGHGASRASIDPAEYGMDRQVAEVTAVLDQLGLKRVHLLGYSMGGRVALQVALAHPERIERLLLESASPGIAEPAERTARIASDEKLARLLEDEGIERFVDVWERVPLFASQRSLPEDARARQRADRLRRDPHALAASLRGAGAGAAPPVVDRLGEIDVPTLIVVGELDEKYVALGRSMASTMPRAELIVVPEAGHAVHLEKPDTFAALTRRFLEEKIALPLA